MFMRCGKQYEFRYIDGLVRPPVIKMITGTGMHVGAEHNGRQKIESHEDLPVSDIVEVAVESFKQRVDEEGYADDAETKGKSSDVVVGEGVDRTASLTKVYAEGIAPTIQPVAVEQKYVVQLGDKELLMYIDVVTDEEGIRDYKSMGRKPSAGTANDSGQLSTYATGYYAEHGKLPKSVGIDAVVATKKPYAESQTSTRTMDDIALVEKLFGTFEQALKAGVFMPAVGTPMCSPNGCGYWDICPYVRKAGK